MLRRFNKKYIYLILLGLSNIVVMAPYSSLDLYGQFADTFGLTDGQIGTLIMCFGIMAVPGYTIGGWLADKFSAKTLMVTAALGTGAVAGFVAMSASFTHLVIAYFLYGTLTGFFYWSAYLKMIRSIGEEHEQGKMFGITDLVFVIFALFMINLMVQLIDGPLATFGYRSVMVIYGSIAIVVGLCIWKIVPYRQAHDLHEEVVSAKLAFDTMKMPITWYLGFFTLGIYIIKSTFTYINPYLTNEYGTSVGFAAATVALLRMGIRCFTSPIGGMIRDKIGRSAPVMMVGSMGCIVAISMYFFVPADPAYKAIVILVSALVMAFSSSLNSCQYTPVAEAGIPLKYSGTLLGIASTLGMSADLWIYKVCGGWLDTYGSEGYNRIFMLEEVGAILMLIASIFIGISLKSRKKHES